MGMQTTAIETESKLIGKQQLLEQLFDEASRPSPRWLDYQISARRIPFVKIGGKIFFELAQVKAAIATTR